MKKKVFTGLIALVAMTVQMTAQPVVGESYKILDTKGAVAVTAHPSGGGGENLQFDAVIAGETPDPSQVFTLEDAGDNLFYIKSEITGAGYITENEGNLTYSQTPATKFYAEQLSDNPAGSYSIIVEGGGLRFLTFNLDWIYFKPVEGGETPDPGVDGTSFVFVSLNGNGGGDTDLPIVPSTDTGAGANWYWMFYDSSWRSRPIEARSQDMGIVWGEPGDALNQQYCFIGNSTEGFSIYNKAFLSGQNDLESDLELRNVTYEQWAKIGFPTTPAVQDRNKWFLDADQNGRLRVKDNIENREWNLNGNSQMEWGAQWGNYAIVFFPVCDLSVYNDYELSPGNNATDVETDAPISITFDENIILGGLNGGYTETVVSLKSGGTEVSGVTASVDGKVFTLAHPVLEENKTYEVTIKYAIIPIVNKEFTWSFTTRQNTAFSAPSDRKPSISVSGKEISVLSNSNDKISVYSVTGALVKQTDARQFAVEQQGIYIVKAGTDVFKIVVK